LQTGNIPCIRSNLVGNRKQSQGQAISDRLVLAKRGVRSAQHGSRKRLSVSQGVRDPVRGDRILEVPGITDERPSRSPRRPKKTRMTGKSAIRRQPDGAQRRVYRRCSFTHDCTKAGGKVEPQISKEPFPGGCSEDQRLTVVGRDRSNAAARS